MALPPKDVKLAGQPVSEVLSVQVSVERRSDGLGQPQGNTLPVHVVIVRKATEKGELTGFKSATNEDGKNVYVDAEFTVVDATGADAYKFKLTHANVTGWQLLSSGDDSDPVREVIELYSGEVTLTVGGTPKSLKLKDWKKAK
jgi:hypothetical protein